IKIYTHSLHDALPIYEDDELIAVRNTDGDKDIGIATKHGYFIRFDENVVRTMGRNAAGVKGISLRVNDEVVSMQIIEPDTYLLRSEEHTSELQSRFDL